MKLFKRSPGASMEEAAKKPRKGFKTILLTASKPFNSLFNKFRSLRIRLKLIIAFLIIIIPTILLGIISYSTAANSIKNIAISTTEDTILHASNYLELLFQNIDSLSMQINSDINIQDFFSNRSGTISSTDREFLEIRDEASTAFTRCAFLNKDVANVLVVGNQNRYFSMKSDVKPDFDYEDVKKTKLYELVSSGLGKLMWFGDASEIYEIIYGKTTDNKETSFALYCSRIMKKINYSYELGLMLIELKLDIFDSLFENMNLDEGSEIHFITPDNYEYYCVKTSAENESVKAIDIINQPFFNSIKESDDVRGASTVTIDSTNYLMFYNKIGNSGCILISLIPESSLLSAARKIAGITVLLVIISIAVALIVGTLIAGGIGDVIHKIAQVAEQASIGNLTVEISSNRQDELGFLSNSISSMISNMRGLIKQVIDLSQAVSKSASLVSNTSQEVSHVSHEISVAIQEISQGASSQASDAEHGTVKMSDLALKINNVSENAKAIEEFSKETLGLTLEGISSIEVLTDKSDETVRIADTIISDVQTLGKNSESIGEIVNVISKIASQTNLLALNAAIEAARAGEMGRGFAVVASEIRKLAEQTMTASREIASLIKSIQSHTIETVEKATMAGGIISSQKSAVQNTSEVFKNINSSIDLLAQKIEQIISSIADMEKNKEEALSAIQNISAVSEETAAYSQEVTASIEEQVSSIEELASFAKELSDTANRLMNEVSTFKIEQ